MPKLWAALECLAFGLLFAVIYYTLFELAPINPLLKLNTPEYFASNALAVSALALLVLRLLPNRQLWLERLVPALFLAAMPVIYVWSALKNAGFLPLEWLGLLIFAGMALYGYRRNYWWVVAGVALHGVAWDAWHYGRVQHIADWYALGCLIVDLAFALLLCVQQIVHKGLTPRG